MSTHRGKCIPSILAQVDGIITPTCKNRVKGKCSEFDINM